MRLYLSLLILFFGLSTIFGAESAQTDTTGSLIFRLFKPELEQGVDYEKGYFMDRLFHRREFHEPIRFIPVELRYGPGYNGGSGFLGLNNPGNWLELESGAETFNPGFRARIAHQLELDIFKINLSNYFLKTSWLDMHTGLNIRYASLLFPSKTPSSWPQINTTWTQEEFSGKLLELSWSQSLILQRYESWYANLRYTYGWANSTFYGRGSPSGSGPSYSYSFGARYIMESDQEYRYAIGLDLKYTQTSINKIKDSGDLTPIKKFTLENFGVFATLSVFFGGELTSGDMGKMHYYRRDYITAKRQLESFVAQHPNHAKRLRAEKFILMSKEKIPLQLMKQGMSFDERGMLDKALDRYRRALDLADTLLVPVLKERIREIAYSELEKAESLLYSGRGDEALVKIKEIITWFPEFEDRNIYFKTENLIQKGKTALQYGFHFKSLRLFEEALKIDPGLEIEINVYRTQIAADLLALADSVKDFRSVRFVIYALEEAEKIIGSLSPGNTRVLTALKSKMADREQYILNRKIKNKIEEYRISSDQKPQPVELGMTIPQVQDLMGHPDEIISQGKDAKDQLWIYHLEDGSEVLMTFSNYILFRIEVE
ncbi:MAG: hypothetical protein V3S22_00890 [Candidatus Neomarinimicrobiota bacterium]